MVLPPAPPQPPPSIWTSMVMQSTSNSSSWQFRRIAVVALFASVVLFRSRIQIQLSPDADADADGTLGKHNNDFVIASKENGRSEFANGSSDWEASETHQVYGNSTSEVEEIEGEGKFSDAPSHEMEGNENVAMRSNNETDAAENPLSKTSFISKEENIYSLTHLAWSDNEIQASSIISISCMEAAYYKYTKHGCCPLERHHPLQIADSFNTSMLLEQWRDKHIVFVGDSLTQQLIDALLTNAHIDGITNTTLYKPPKHGSDIIFFESTNTTISKSPTGGGGISPINGQLLSIDHSSGPHHFEDSIYSADVAYVSFGLHLLELSEEQCIMLFRYIRKVLEDDMARHPYKRHYYRTTFPQHFESRMTNNGSVMGADWRDKTSTKCVGYGIDTTDHWTSKLAKQVFRGSTVTVLDYSDFLRYRGDLHSLYNPQDCSHWCWDYEMWRGVFYLMHAASMLPI